MHICFLRQTIKDLNLLKYNSLLIETAKTPVLNCRLYLLQMPLLNTSEEYISKFKHGSEYKYHQNNGVEKRMQNIDTAKNDAPTSSRFFTKNFAHAITMRINLWVIKRHCCLLRMQWLQLY